MTEPAAGKTPEQDGAPLGLIAGSGDLPRLIAEDRRRRGADTVVVRFEGVEAPWAEGFPHLDLPFEKPGALFAGLRAAGASALCFAGAMKRPRLNPLRFDRTAFGLIAKVPPLLLKRDDAMLRGFAGLLEAEGFHIVAAHEQLEGLLAPQGVLGAVQPDEAAALDAEIAERAAADLGRRDLGQAAVAAGGAVAGLEAREGTDALLSDLARSGAAKGGVLHKGPKPGQDWRLDLPAIGPGTLRAAAAAGLAGVSVQAGGVLVLGLDASIAQADAEGLFLWGRPPSDGTGG